MTSSITDDKLLEWRHWRVVQNVPMRKRIINTYIRHDFHDTNLAVCFCRSDAVQQWGGWLWRIMW